MNSSFVVGLAAFVFAAGLHAQCISHSIDNFTIQVGNSVACTTPAGSSVAQSYWREYDLSFFALTGPMDIQAVKFGIEACASGVAAQPQNITVRLYQNPAPGSINPGILILLTTQTFQVNDTNGTARIETVNLNPTVTMMPNDAVVVEISSANLTATNGNFFLGTNNIGETAPTYLSSAGCGVGSPVTMTSIGFPTIHGIIDLQLGPAMQTAIFPGTGEDLAILTAVNMNPLTAGIGNDVKMCNALDVVNIRTDSFLGTFDFGQLLVVGHIFFTGFQPNSPFPGIHVNPNFGTGAFLVAGGGGPLGNILLPPSGFNLTLQVPLSLGGSGVSFILQSIVPFTGAANGIFASSDAHEFRVN